MIKVSKLNRMSIYCFRIFNTWDWMGLHMTGFIPMMAVPLCPMHMCCEHANTCFVHTFSQKSYILYGSDPRHRLHSLLSTSTRKCTRHERFCSKKHLHLTDSQLESGPQYFHKYQYFPQPPGVYVSATNDVMRDIIKHHVIPEGAPNTTRVFGGSHNLSIF